MNRAVVWYDRDDPPAKKRRILIDGLTEIVLELYEEHGMTPDQIRDALDEAADEVGA